MLHSALGDSSSPPRAPLKFYPDLPLTEGIQLDKDERPYMQLHRCQLPLSNLFALTAYGLRLTRTNLAGHHPGSWLVPQHEVGPSSLTVIFVVTPFILSLGTPESFLPCDLFHTSFPFPLFRTNIGLRASSCCHEYDASKACCSFVFLIALFSPDHVLTFSGLPTTPSRPTSAKP